MRDFLLVGGGGFAGSVLRYYFGSLVTHLSGITTFPIATLTVNVTGCFIVGALSFAAEHLHLLSPQARLFLLTGLLGGFTTFSAFGYETYFLARNQQTFLVLLNVLLQIGAGLIAVWLGHKAIELLTGT